MKIYRWFCTWLLINVVLSASLSPFLTPQIFAQTVKPATILADSQHIKSAAYEWLDIALEATAREHERVAPRPTVGSRMLAIIVTSMYNAWAATMIKRLARGLTINSAVRSPSAFEQTKKRQSRTRLIARCSTFSPKTKFGSKNRCGGAILTRTMT